MIVSLEPPEVVALKRAPGRQLAAARQAAHLQRWAGHRNLELLTLQNMSMQAEYLNRRRPSANQG
jgi:hypothetical protein